MYQKYAESHLAAMMYIIYTHFLLLMFVNVCNDKET